MEVEHPFWSLVDCGMLDGCWVLSSLGLLYLLSGSRVSMLAVPQSLGSFIALDVYVSSLRDMPNIVGDVSRMTFFGAACLLGEISELLSMHDCYCVSGFSGPLVAHR